MSAIAHNIAIRKKDGAECQGMRDATTMGRMGRRMIQLRQSPATTQNRKRTGQRLGKGEAKVQGNIITIRQQARLTKIIDGEPDTEAWLIQEYTEQDMGIEIRNRANRKARGNDGTPGQAYRESIQWAIKSIAK